MKTDPKLDLVLERAIDVKPELVWKAWTVPEHVKKWLTPAPWKTVECSIDLRPGGRFAFVMESPEGQRFPHEACFLEVEPNKKLTWTVALEAGYRPSLQSSEVPPFTATVLIEPHGKGAKYTAIARHADAAGAKKHADMGFVDGWGKALDQLVALARTMG